VLKVALTREYIGEKTDAIFTEAAEEAAANVHALDSLREKEFIRDELAVDIIAEMVGDTVTELREAERKNDLSVVTLLRHKLSHFRKEQLEVYAGNACIKEKCIREYAPILKQRYEFLKESMAENKV
jgi:hypothetical protein